MGVDGVPTLADLGFSATSDAPLFVGLEHPWTLLDPSHSSGLKQQFVNSMPSTSSVAGELHPSCVLDEGGGPIKIEPGAVVGPFVLIEGPAYIGRGVEVRQGAFVRPYTWACEGSVIGHATEIKHSLLMPGAKAPHFNYVGDSLLASGVNLGAGSVLSNLRHDGAEVVLRQGDEHVSTGLRKFGAILGRDVQIGCNAVTNPGTILGPGSLVWPNACVIGLHPAGCSLR
ncbi:MAG: UDP-N-acetylglucosamine pyrophosphorylase [Euryarchaeota archaeon]|nr:UDP-N-acetylglucosamine pyrophosphorylase [Euryarchaeota archaeon]